MKLREFSRFCNLENVYARLITFMALLLPSPTAKTVSLKAHKNVSSHYNNLIERKIIVLKSFAYR